MESPEQPECPVCLQNYDGEYAIPRVLACGHSTCEPCLKLLPQKYPHTIRCPSCNQLVKFHGHSPSSLPKNIDLLRLLTTTTPQNPRRRPHDHLQFQGFSDSHLWPDGFYATWKTWVLPHDAVSGGKEGVMVEGNGKMGAYKIGMVDFGERASGSVLGGGEGFWVLSDEKVRLFKVGMLGLRERGSGSVSKVGYVAKILSFLNGMKEEEREELRLVLEVCSRRPGVCRVHGLWGDLGGGDLYLVCERIENLGGFENGFREDELSGFAMMGMEMCESVIGLHLEGLVMGCLGISCFDLDCFGHAKLNLGEFLALGRAVCEGVVEVGSGTRRIGGKEMGMLVSKFLEKLVFVSPEVLFEVLKKEGIEVECSEFGYSAGYGSDVWSLAHVLLRLLIGEQFIQVLVDYVEHITAALGEENRLEFSCLYVDVPKKVSFLLKTKFGDGFESVQEILCNCLNFDPGSRPLMIDVWKCFRELITTFQFDTLLRLDGPFINDKNKGNCLVVGELCRASKEISEAPKKDGLQEVENSSGENIDEVKVNANKDFVEGLVEGHVKFDDMQGHRDCVTGLAIGGGFLFSSSFDKSVHVWSLQDFSHIHTFKGHEHKVMAVIYVDEEEPLCISGDSGGGIFLWSISIPLRQEPLKKWNEQADWRYSGIHALTAAGNGCLYTGSGDRLIKEWSLQDGNLLCTMEGHKSVVSTLAAYNGVLYSGSWDGTIRLWSLNDHCLLSVLGEDVPGNVTSVLSLFATGNMLVASYENGHIKVWRNDEFVKSIKLYNGAIFAIEMEGNLLFTGGWDKTINVQELIGDELQVDIIPLGSIPGGSVITALLFWQGKLFVGYGDRKLKVFYCGR